MGQAMRNERGFTLIEVLICIMIFAFFVAAYYSGESSNKQDSLTMREELILQELAETKLNEILSASTTQDSDNSTASPSDSVNPTVSSTQAPSASPRPMHGCCHSTRTDVALASVVTS